MSYRSLEVRASSLNLENRTIEADVTTENPVMVPDYGRMEMVPEVLVTKGAVIPDSRQVPFLDSHNRASVSNQLGSARDIATKYNKLTARLHFSEAAGPEFTKVREGHVTDVSAGYQILKKQYIPAGETKSIMGRSYTGPVNVVTKWRLREVSLTPIGADEQAKLRGFDPAALITPEEESFTMKLELKAWLVTRGMPEDLNDEQAQDWMLANKERTIDEIKPKKNEQPVEEGKREERTEIDAEELAVKVAEAANAIFEKKRAAEESFRKEVDATCDLAQLPEHKEHCRGLKTLDEVRSFLQTKQKEVAEKIPYGVSIRQVGSGFENLTKDMGSALTLRALNSASSGSESSRKAIDEIFPVADRGKRTDTFKYASLYDMASEWVRAMGIDTRGLPRETVAICAMFGPEVAGVRMSGPAYNTTGNFTNLTLDASNKAMMLGYMETPATWRGPMRQAASVPDFKNINRLRMGAIPNLPIWNDNASPEKATFADAREYYAVEAYSLEISFSYRLLVNDDMDALSRAPAMAGAAAARTVNAVAWAQITSNPTMSDSVALFSAATGNRKRQNLTTGSGTPTVANVGSLTALMRLMRGENTPEQVEGGDILNLRPAYIVGPAALETTINQLVNSAYDPAATSAVNTQVYNPTRVLTPVIEPLLDAASSTAWYLFASPSQIDTVEVSFLQGQETPVTRQFMDQRNLAQNLTVLQTFAAKAMNHRGIQKHAGA